MSQQDLWRPMVSIGLPVFNGARTVPTVVRSVLSQDYPNLELLISDNGSTDETEAICRALAATDDRIVYHRHPVNVGLLNNFMHVMNMAKGEFFRWVGDDDWLAPNYVSRCLRAFASDTRLILVTTQLEYVRPDGSTYSQPYSETAFYADDAIERFERLIAHLIDDDLPIDPLYALARRTSLVGIPRRNVIREDEVFAAKLALTGPWGHVPEILARQNLRIRGRGLAKYLGVSGWQAHLPTAVQCWEILNFLSTDALTSSQRRRARAAVARLFACRHYRTLVRRVRKVVNTILQARS